jgi:hypothetical protein
MMRGKQTSSTLIFLIYLALGLYLLNSPFNFIPLPEPGKWFIFIIGFFLIAAGIKFIRASSQMGYGPVY